MGIHASFQPRERAPPLRRQRVDRVQRGPLATSLRQVRPAVVRCVVADADATALTHKLVQDEPSLCTAALSGSIPRRGPCHGRRQRPLGPPGRRPPPPLTSARRAAAAAAATPLLQTPQQATGRRIVRQHWQPDANGRRGTGRAGTTLHEGGATRHK